MARPSIRAAVPGHAERIRAAAELELRRREKVKSVDSLRVDLPPWADVFNRTSRYKVAYGGRGSGKSWTYARMLLLRAAKQKIRVLCARELQISIKDSVHRLLMDQVYDLGLSHAFDMGQSYIRGHNGSEFIFKGLRLNAAEIKSMEGIDLCWVEEAEAVSERSWELLIPTIRAPGSEIWITFNPHQETDPTYQRFVVNAPDGAIVQQVNYDLNPWFPEELERERAYMARTDPDAYAHVWLGQFKLHSQAEVLHGKWCIDCFEPQPDWKGPYFGADWGFAKDPTVLVKVWIHERSLYVEHEAYGIEVALDDLPDLFSRVPDARRYEILGDSSRPETINHLANHGWQNVFAAPKWPGSVEDGVEFLRSFERIIIHDRCRHTAEEARLWRYKTDPLTEAVLPILIDKNDHCWDATRYALARIIRGRQSAFWLPDPPTPPETNPLTILQQAIDRAAPEGSCGACKARIQEICTDRGLRVRLDSPGCDAYRPR